MCVLLCFIVTHLKLWIAVARHDFKWVKTFFKILKFNLYNVALNRLIMIVHIFQSFQMESDINK